MRWFEASPSRATPKGQTFIFRTASLPNRNSYIFLPFTFGTQQRPEVGLHLAKVGQQVPSRRGELLIAVSLTGRIHHRDLTSLYPGDLRIKLGAPTMQLLQPDVGIGLRAERHLPQQLEHDV